MMDIFTHSEKHDCTKNTSCTKKKKPSYFQFYVTWTSELYLVDKVAIDCVRVWYRKFHKSKEVWAGTWRMGPFFQIEKIHNGYFRQRDGTGKAHSLKQRNGVMQDHVQETVSNLVGGEEQTQLGRKKWQKIKLLCRRCTQIIKGLECLVNNFCNREGIWSTA